MMMQRIKILACLMVALSLLVLTGCELPFGGDEAESTVESSEIATESDSAPTDTTMEEATTENPDVHLGNEADFTWESFYPFA